MSSFMPVMGRIAGAIVAAIGVFLLDNLGVQLTEEQAEGLAAGVNMIGLAVFSIIYAVVHKQVNRFIAPMDAAKYEGGHPVSKESVRVQTPKH